MNQKIEMIYDGDATSNKPKQLNHIASLQVEETASEGQKEFARNYNSMREMLLQNKLMKSK